MSLWQCLACGNSLKKFTEFIKISKFINKPVFIRMVARIMFLKEWNFAQNALEPSFLLKTWSRCRLTHMKVPQFLHFLGQNHAHYM